MAKIICENARVDMFSGLERGVPMKKPVISCKNDCPICHGVGYTELAVITVSEVRKKFNAACSTSHYEKFGSTIFHFLDWLDEKEKEVPDETD
jgi:hypothetical protein